MELTHASKLRMQPDYNQSATNPVGDGPPREAVLSNFLRRSKP